MINHTEKGYTVYNEQHQQIFSVINPALGLGVLSMNNGAYKVYTRDQLRDIADVILMVTNNESLW